MRYTRSLISFVILTMLVGLGSLVLSTSQVKAQQQNCGVEIVKIAFPADDTVFDFTVTGIGLIEFALMAGDSNNFLIPVGSGVTVTEDVPPGWILDEVECTEPDGVIINFSPTLVGNITITCNQQASVTCNFINRRVVADVPTLSEWGLIAMTGVLGIAGFMVIKRRKVIA